MEWIPCQTIVRLKKTGQLGVTIDDSPPLDVCLPEETPVVFEGTDCGIGVLTEELEVVGPENAVAGLEPCGAGTEQCCIFLAAQGKREGGCQMTCQRFGPLRISLILKAGNREMRAQRQPVEFYPRCQLRG